MCNSRGGRLAVAVMLSLGLCVSIGWSQPAGEFNKGPDSSATGPAARATGGPDAFGYSFIDSGEAGGPTYAYVDVSGTGSAAIVGYSDDSVAGPFPIGFTFNFYGVDHTQFWVQTNGSIAFALPTDDDYGNDCLPATTEMGEELLNLLWDDLICGSGPPGTIFYETQGSAPNRTLVIQFNNVRYLVGSDTDTIEFEVILYEGSNDIVYQYADLSSNVYSHDGGVSATIGIQGNVTNYLLEYACDPATPLAVPLAVLFTLGGAAADVDLSISKTSDAGGVVLPGDTLIYTIAVTNQSATDAASGVLVTDMLPTNVTYGSDTCGGAFGAGVWTWNIGALAANGVASCDVTVTVNADATGPITNSVTVAGNENDPNGADNTDRDVVSLQGHAIPTSGRLGTVVFLLLLAAAGFVALRRFI